jgi:hypothetical protein
LHRVGVQDPPLDCVLVFFLLRKAPSKYKR